MIFRIQEMTSNSIDYFQYFPAAKEMATWGLALTGAGFTRVRPGASYPPLQHPIGHHFSWKHGRVLEALQIVLITDGRGQLETHKSKERTIESGTAFALLPNEWHRYHPDPRSGWTESWIEVQGPLVRRLLSQNMIRGDDAVRTGALAAGLDTALEEIHALARIRGPRFDPDLAAKAIGVLAMWPRCENKAGRPSRIEQAVLEAERMLAERFCQPIVIRDMALNLGVSYSQFRRAFQAHTGYAPWQFVLHLRLMQARRMLASSDATLDAMASSLGFSSGFHLSNAFKGAFGVSPIVWRRRISPLK